jgi:Ca2+-binding RTX toxin-like protein
MRPSRTSTARTGTIAIVMLLALGAFAPAAMAGTVTFSGDTLVFTGGDNLDHEVQFRFNPSTGEDEIIDSQSITSIPVGCTYVFSNTWVSCPPHSELRVELGAGNDFVTTAHSTMGDCFVVYTINLGEGTNGNDMNRACSDAGATATISAGSGEDTLRGGSASTRVTIFAGSGADTLNGGDGDDVIHGGEGNERAVDGGPGNDQVLGEGGNDVIRGDDGNDLEDGGPGDDDIGYSPGVSHDDDTGADQLVGGAGTDRLRLSGHSGGMAISLDGQANDGAPGEGDNVGSDIEKIEGTKGNDVFTGSAGADNFEGDSGDDEIHGAGGNDDLYGGGGDDRVFGDAGNDKVQGANGSDSVDGGPGLDQIYGDIGSCSFSCSFDADSLFARDGERDAVDCGGGADTAQVDELDVVAFCASVDRQSVAGGGVAGGGVPGEGSPAKASFAGSKRSVTVSRTGRFSYSLRAGARLAGKAVFRSVKKVRTSRRARVTLATKSFTAPSSGKVTLKIKLSRKALATLRRNRTIKSKVTVTLKNAAGLSSVASTTVTLKR